MPLHAARFGGLLCLLVLAGCGEAAVEAPSAPPMRLRAESDAAQVSIFDPVTVSLRADYAEGVVPELPEGLPPVAGLTIDEAREEGPRVENGRTVITRTFTLHAEQPGSYIIPAFTVPYTLADGTAAEAATGRLFLDVRSVLGESENDLAALRPIKPPVAIPRDYTPLLLVAGGVLLGCLLAGAAVVWWLKRRGVLQEAPAPPLPAHEAALAALAALERGSLLERGRIREYVYELTEIFREYLERRYGVAAVASTTEQLLPLLMSTPVVPPETSVLAKRLAQGADPIKFAGAAGSADMVRGWTADLRRYVETTRPRAELREAA